jgi:hypothetical protein
MPQSDIDQRYDRGGGQRVPDRGRTTSVPEEASVPLVVESTPELATVERRTVTT